MREWQHYELLMPQSSSCRSRASTCVHKSKQSISFLPRKGFWQAIVPVSIVFKRYLIPQSARCGIISSLEFARMLKPPTSYKSSVPTASPPKQQVHRRESEFAAHPSLAYRLLDAIRWMSARRKVDSIERRSDRTPRSAGEEEASVGCQIGGEPAPRGGIFCQIHRK